MQFKTVSPVGDRVYIKVDNSEEKTTSGLLLPVSAQKKPTQGEVVTAGTAKSVKVRLASLVFSGPVHAVLNAKGAEQSAVLQNGDKIVYSKYAGTELKVSGQDFVLLKVTRH